MQKQKKKVRLENVPEDVAVTLKTVSIALGLPEDEVLKQAILNFSETSVINEQLQGVTVPQLLASIKAGLELYTVMSNMIRSELETRLLAIDTYATMFDKFMELQNKMKMFGSGQLPPQQQEQQQQEQKSEIAQVMDYLIQRISSLEEKIEQMKSGKEHIEKEVEEEMSLIEQFVDLDTIKKLVRPAVTNLFANLVRYGVNKVQQVLS